MTNVIFRELPDSGAIEMRVQGHAGFRELGKDPVCAGASILAFTVAQCIEVMEPRKLEKAPNIIIKDGSVRVVVKPKPDFYGEAFHIFAVGEVGFHILSKSYPDHVELIPFMRPARDE